MNDRGPDLGGAVKLKKGGNLGARKMSEKCIGESQKQEQGSSAKKKNHEMLLDLQFHKLLPIQTLRNSPP